MANKSVWVIYKQIVNRDTGEIEGIEMLEACSSDKESHSYSRLYTLQTPPDAKDTMSFLTMRIPLK